MISPKRNPVYISDDAHDHKTAVQKRCPRCGSYPCRCPQAKSAPANEQTAYIERDRKGRGGKTVTVVSNLTLSEDDLKRLSKRLKKLCGSGGAIKEGNVEIQGDHREVIALDLQKQGYKTKFKGG